jgi:hypothetical protein
MMAQPTNEQVIETEEERNLESAVSIAMRTTLVQDSNLFQQVNLCLKTLLCNNTSIIGS